MWCFCKAGNGESGMGNRKGRAIRRAMPQRNVPNFHERGCDPSKFEFAVLSNAVRAQRLFRFPIPDSRFPAFHSRFPALSGATA